jgi:hypothetical protein
VLPISNSVHLACAFWRRERPRWGAASAIARHQAGALARRRQWGCVRRHERTDVLHSATHVDRPALVTAVAAKTRGSLTPHGTGRRPVRTHYAVVSGVSLT